MYFQIKNTLKSNRNRIPKQTVVVVTPLILEIHQFKPSSSYFRNVSLIIEKTSFNYFCQLKFLFIQSQKIII